MKKRGFSRKADANVEIIFFIADLLALVIIFFALLKYVDSVEEDTQFERNYLSRDLALMVDTLYASPGNTQYNYRFKSINLTEFIFSFEEQDVEVRDKGRPQHTYFPYADDLFFGTLSSGEMTDREMLYLTKQGRKISVTEPAFDENMMYCEDADTIVEGEKRVVIDPGHGGDDKGFIAYNGQPESDIVRWTAFAVNQISETRYNENQIRIIQTRNLEYDDDKTKEERLEIIETESPHIVISLHISNEITEEANIRAYIPKQSKESMKLACVMLNSLTSFYTYDLTSSIIISEEELLYTNPRVASVTLELGSAQLLSNRMLERTGETGERIYNALEEYFK